MTFIFQLPRQAVLIFFLILAATTCTSSLIPTMGYFIVEGLGQPAWKIGFFTGFMALITMGLNRLFGQKLDAGFKPRLLIGGSIVCFMCFAGLAASMPDFWIFAVVGAPLMAMSNSASGTTFTFGRQYANQNNLDAGRYNAFLRTAISIAWMIGPASAFLLIDQFGFQKSYLLSASAGLVWLGLWAVTVPKDFHGTQSPKSAVSIAGIDWALWFAAVACTCFALSNVIFTSVLPLFLIKDAQLPGYAPGVSLTAKCFVEVFAIFSAARLAERFGARNVMLASAALAIVVFNLFAQADSMIEVVFLAALEGLYYGLFAGISITFIQNFTPTTPGRATAIYMNSLFLGSMIGSVSMGFIASAFSFGTVVIFAAFSSACAFITLLVTRKMKPREATA
ncbi:MAG: MFS transporter [Rhodobacteraceae bacterium]|nr:MFS transporter [Paracoccaceae bacterium]